MAAERVLGQVDRDEHLGPVPADRGGEVVTEHPPTAPPARRRGRGTPRRRRRPGRRPTLVLTQRAASSGAMVSMPAWPGGGQQVATEGLAVQRAGGWRSSAVLEVVGMGHDGEGARPVVGNRFEGHGQAPGVGRGPRTRPPGIASVHSPTSTRSRPRPGSRRSRRRRPIPAAPGWEVVHHLGTHDPHPLEVDDVDVAADAQSQRAAVGGRRALRCRRLRRFPRPRVGAGAVAHPVRQHVRGRCSRRR